MDPHVAVCEQLFSAARAEFKHLEYFYFHNFTYEYVWRDNRRRRDQRFRTWDLIHSFGPDYKLIFVGDATMSPYEMERAGGSVEHYNEEPGIVWLQRLREHYRRSVWLNPEPSAHWNYTSSIQLIQRLMGGHMYPLTLEGLGRAIRFLSK